MFQTYEAPEGGQDTAERVARLREVMARPVDAVLVPHADEYMNEYVPPCGQRLAWLTGFTGSAGLAVIARKAAALFVDGRYILQAPEQMDTETSRSCRSPRPSCRTGSASTSGRRRRGLRSLAAFAEHPGGPGEGARKQAHQAEGAGEESHRSCVGTAASRPATGPRRPAPSRVRGRAAKEKLAELQATLKKDGQDAVVLTFPDSICWLFNIRGSDVAHNPVALAFAIVPAIGRPELFIDPAKIGPEAKAHLAPLARLSEPAALEQRLGALKQTGKCVRLSPGAPVWFSRKLKGGKARVVSATDPCILPKARKNAAEIKGARAAHKRDGAAVVRFLAWLDREAEKGGIDEIAAARQLETMRSETQALKEISFDTISGSGPNGAIVHYRVTAPTNRKLKPGELYLVDSGAQYLDGTTDVTRTVAIGTPTREMWERFTLVLRGHITISTARFPKGTRGVDLDPFARRALWEAGLDFDHGTGHGVGSYLSVHEGPQSISKAGMTVLEPGMIISNEPGYYKTGAYGIRIENLVLVNEPEKVAGGEREVMSFETLTLVPIDRRLVVPEMLSPAELDWLNAYHARVREVIGPELGPADRAWLEQATAAIPSPHSSVGRGLG